MVTSVGAYRHDVGAPLAEAGRERQLTIAARTSGVGASSRAGGGARGRAGAAPGAGAPSPSGQDFVTFDPQGRVMPFLSPNRKVHRHYSKLNT